MHRNRFSAYEMIVLVALGFTAGMLALALIRHFEPSRKEHMRFTKQVLFSTGLSSFLRNGKVNHERTR